jgi:hypothetical protein
MEKEGRTPVEEEEEPRTPSQVASKDREYETNTDEKCCGSNSYVIVKLQHQKEHGSPSYVHYRRHTSK